MTLNITGGGAATLNAGDSGVSAVNLQSSTSAYIFTPTLRRPWSSTTRARAATPSSSDQPPRPSMAALAQPPSKPPASTAGALLKGGSGE